MKHSIPPRWKKIDFDYGDINENETYAKIITLSKEIEFLPLDKLSSQEIYLTLISSIANKPNSNIYFDKLFENTLENS